MSWITRQLRQTAIYWPRIELDHYGRPVYGAPSEIAVRWEEATEEVRTTEGNFLRFNARVFSDQQMQEGDRIKLGEMDSRTPTDPTEDPLAIQVQKVMVETDMKGRVKLHTYYL
jgi:hypothetical protein